MYQDHLFDIYEGKEKGPLIIAIGSMHGNEPAGLQAIREFFFQISNFDPEASGTIAGVIGNLEALKSSERYIHRDLNRTWDHDSLRLLHQKRHPNIEDKQQLDLLELIDDLIERHGYDRPVYLLDFHTTSADNGTFIISPDRSNSDFTQGFHLPVVFGLTALLHSTLIQYYSHQGVNAIAVEAGDHHMADAPQIMQAVIWRLMHKIGMIDLTPESSDRVLHKYGRHLPDNLFMVYNHTISPLDNFKMKPGYKNFHEVKVGELLAHDKDGPIYSKWDGHLLMPLYQKSGSEGFFIAEDF